VVGADVADADAGADLRQRHGRGIGARGPAVHAVVAGRDAAREVATGDEELEGDPECRLVQGGGGPPRLQHTAVWLGRQSAHAWEPLTARPYPKRSLGSAAAAEAFAAAPTSSAPEQSAAPEARTVHAREPPAARYNAAVALASPACTVLPYGPQHQTAADALVLTTQVKPSPETSKRNPPSACAGNRSPPRHHRTLPVLEAEALEEEL